MAVGVTGRVAVVTGAARGIGAATVRALAADGWSVLAVDIAAGDPDLPYPLGSTADLAAVVADAPDRVHPFVADVRDPDAVEAAVGMAENRWGGVGCRDRLCRRDCGRPAALAGTGGRTAGGARRQPRCVLTLARAAIPALLRRPRPRHGRFLAVASAAATRGLPDLAAYCAAKAGVAGLIRALGRELGGTGITANAVSPGSTDTPILAESARLYGLPNAEAFAAQQPIGRLLEPREIAAVLAFLAGPGSSGMTGAVVPVDGGLAL